MRICVEKSEIKKVCPKDDQKAINNPKTRKRHSVMINSLLPTCIVEIDEDDLIFEDIV